MEFKKVNVLDRLIYEIKLMTCLLIYKCFCVLFNDYSRAVGDLVEHCTVNDMEVRVQSLVMSACCVLQQHTIKIASVKSAE